MPLSTGSWQYQADGAASQARFGASPASFILRCDRASRRVSLARAGAAPGSSLTLRTSYNARRFPLAADPALAGQAAAALLANDRLLDEIAFSRGRFTAEVPGMPMLVIPAWPEAARVVEDCRA